MSRNANEILREIDMKAACFVDMLKRPVEADQLTIYINNEDYDILADFAIDYMFISFSTLSKAVFNSYKGMHIEIAPHLKDIQIGLKLIMPDEATKLLQQDT